MNHGRKSAASAFFNGLLVLEPLQIDTGSDAVLLIVDFWQLNRWA